MSYTIKDIAQKTNLSRSTISRVLNQSANVNEETRKIVISAIEEMGYVPNMIARGLRTQTRLIAVITQDILNPYYIEAIYEIEKTCRERGYTLLHLNSDRNPQLEEQNIYHVLAMKAQGVILIANMLDHNNRYLKLCSEQTQVVTMEGEARGIDSVLSDVVPGVYAAVDYMLKLGHTHIGLCHGHCRSLPIQNRIHAFYQRMQAYGNICESRDAFFSDDYLMLLDQALSEGRLPTAIFTLNDNTAINVYRWCKQKGLRIPQDLSILGFDNIAMSDLLVPPLTTIEQPISYLCKTAIEMLLDRISRSETPQPSIQQSVQVATRLVIRESIGSPRKPETLNRFIK